MDLSELQKKAENGDAESQYKLGQIYFIDWMSKLYGVENDYQKAAEWFAKAAEQGNADAMCQLGTMYSGYGLGNDYSQAVQLISQSAAKGDVTAMRNLGVLFADGKGVPKRPDIAEQCFISAAIKGGTQMEYELGHRYQYGGCIPVDYAKAVYWHEKASERHHLEAMRALVHLYDHGLGVRQNHIKADSFRERVDEADVFEKSEEESEEKAEEFLQKRYDNFPGELRQLARWYMNGFLCSPNLRRAESLLHEAVLAEDGKNLDQIINRACLRKHRREFNEWEEKNEAKS